MVIGIDLGTSSIKVVLLNDDGELVATTKHSLNCHRPKPLHSEQNPSEWLEALDIAMLQLGKKYPLSNVKAIGLAGQMHGAVLLDVHGDVLRPAILWDDGRSEAQCKMLETAVPNSREITGNLMMPGFTAPKLLWVKEHEPELFAQIDKVLLPKDYIRYILSGEFVSDMSDASGTMWLDVRNRCWSETMLSATGLTLAQMPNVIESNKVSSLLSRYYAERWGLSSLSSDEPVKLVAGAGDNAAGAIGVGLTEPGQAMLSLGTSGVYYLVTDTFSPCPQKAVHNFCHSLPEKWHLMTVILSAASCVDWLCNNVINKDIDTMFGSLKALSNDYQTDVVFLPYLSGERTPHNDPYAKGVFFGLTHTSTDIEMFVAVLEGVSFAFAEGLEALEDTQQQAQQINVIGGGAKSPFWRQLLCNILQQPIIFRRGSEAGPAVGAARLALIAIYPELPLDSVCSPGEVEQQHEPSSKMSHFYDSKYMLFKALYQQISPLFAKSKHLTKGNP